MKINRVEKKKKGEMLLEDIEPGCPFMFLPSGHAPFSHRVQNTIWIKVYPTNSFHQKFRVLAKESCNTKMVVDIKKGRLANINIKASIQLVEYNLEIGEME
ncbi:hypothetical protein LCGC14_0729590 [marine sediment metagenome]|uniref:Uncharacterized protein n=1 Tax=marine sediment metagenome TaxID=412755 RepID=A0A0F9QV27_9ZZZZ